jgi:CRP-like cAMP-binding protein
MKKNSLVVQALRQSALFKQLADDDLDVVAESTKLRQFFASETIVSQGHPSDSLYLIANGIVSIQRRTGKAQSQTLAYLMPGNTFGEVGILENQPRSATVMAVTEVDVLVIRRAEFLDILHRYPTVTIELAKMLGRYLVESNKRIARGNSRARMILIFDIFGGSGATSVGVMLAHVLAERTKQKTIYTEHPFPQKLVADMQVDKKTRLIKHKSGYDLLLSHDDPGLPDAVKTAFMLDRVAMEYDNIIVTLNEPIDEDSDGKLDQDIEMMLDNVRQIIMLVPPDKAVWAQIEGTQRMLRRHLRRDEVNIFTLVNHATQGSAVTEQDFQADFHVPYIDDFPPLREAHTDAVQIPSQLHEIFAMLVDRLERSHNIGVFIPTTIDVDQAVDTRPFVDRTLNFLAQRFGGATCREAQGVWNSEQAGLVGETVYIVNTHVTKNDMDKYIDEVITYIKDLKVELKQEAMALEVNQRMTLI